MTVERRSVDWEGASAADEFIGPFTRQSPHVIIDIIFDSSSIGRPTMGADKKRKTTTECVGWKKGQGGNMKEWILGPINNEQMHSAFTADSAKRFWLVWLLEAYFRGFPPSPLLT